MNSALAEDLAKWLLSEIDSADNARTSTYLLGMRWDLLPGVWPPDPVTRLFTSWLPFVSGERFLEVGCGAGVTCIVAAQRGCEAVVGLDINAAAAENTRLNAAQHGVADRVTALASDLFEELGEDDRFDVIFSNPPQIKASVGRSHSTGIQAGALDPGFSMHRRFFQEVGLYLAEGGRIYMGANEAIGDAAELQRVAADAGFVGRKYRTAPIQIPGAVVGLTPAVRAAVDQHGILKLDITMFEFRRS